MWDLPGLGIEPMSPAWQMDSKPLDHQGSPQYIFNLHSFIMRDIKYLFIAYRATFISFSICLFISLAQLSVGL